MLLRGCRVGVVWVYEMYFVRKVRGGFVAFGAFECSCWYIVGKCRCRYLCQSLVWDALVSRSSA